MWNPGCGILAGESWLWNPGCGILAVEVSGGVWGHQEASGQLGGMHWLAWLACLAALAGWGWPGTIRTENIDFSLIFTVFKAATERLA